MALMVLAFFGNGFAFRHIVAGLVSGAVTFDWPDRGSVFNFVGGLGGITVSLVVDYLAQDYGFAPALIYIAVVALLGARSYSAAEQSETRGGSLIAVVAGVKAMAGSAIGKRVSGHAVFRSGCQRG